MYAQEYNDHFLHLPLAPPQDVPSSCPPDKPPVNCLLDPCSVTSCPAHPDASCVADYCGGCNARFFDADGNEVTESCNN